MKIKAWLLEICTYLLALLFLFTALSKLINLHEFTRQMEGQVFPKAIVPLLIVLVPLAELIAFILLIRSSTRLKGLWLSLILMTAFTVYTGLITLHVFPKVPCACAGAFNRLSWEQHLALNGVFTFMALMAILLFIQQERLATRTQGA